MESKHELKEIDFKNCVRKNTFACLFSVHNTISL